MNPLPEKTCRLIDGLVKFIDKRDREQAMKAIGLQLARPGVPLIQADITNLKGELNDGNN
ncbi:MAG: hypothetical protein LBU36_02505 [Clostridiales bacterium]|nr:hypothetical protein [Clostridiales bacterium]